MADQHSVEGSSTSNASPESSESTVELNIKTLDSQIYSFHVDKNITVSMFKEKIANEIGVPVGQQRLIFRGKVLKDNHLLSEYHVENGHTLHLVARQVSEGQSSSSSISGETNTNSNNTGQDASASGVRPRVGQHSVVLGTFGLGDQGEAGVPDISRVIGAVLNSIGIGGQTAMGAVGGVQPNMQFNIPVPAAQGNETEGSQGNNSSQSQAGNQSLARQASPGQFMPQVVQIPLGTAIAMPSLNVPIPDSLNTLSVFMNRMEVALSQDGGFQPNQPSINTVSSPPVELPSNARGLPTPAALAIVLRHAERLISGPAISSLAHIAGRLEQEEDSTDVTVRNQIQTESIQAGLAMQHLGALLLELGRTMLTLRIGQSPAESSVNAGPAVYISPSGPNPIMVQPFPLQASSLFGGFAAPPSNPGTFGPVGVGAVPRHVNIHIHTAIGPRTTNGEANQGGVNGTGDPGQTRVLPRNVTATAIPLRPTAVSVSGAVQPTVVVSQPSPDPVSLSTIVAGINSQIRNSVDNMPSENQAPAGQPGNSTGHHQSITSNAGVGVGETSSHVPGCVPETEGRTGIRGIMDVNDTISSSTAGNAESSSGGKTRQKSIDDAECAPTSSLGAGNSESGKAVPLGLGLGGLQPKRRSRLTRTQGRSSDSTPTTEQNPQSSSGGSGASGQLDPAKLMSQAIQSPALEGLLSGVSQQTGIGSPDALRNMLGQLTQNPAMMNTVNQIAQQIDSQDLGSMFSGLGAGQGGGMDLSRMVQQMMPIVSQALGGGMNAPQQVPAMARELQPSYSQRRPSSDEKPNDQHSQNYLQQAVQRIEHQDPPREILRSVVDSAVRLFNSGIQTGGLAEELCAEEGLATEFIAMLRRDVSRRLQDESGTGEKS